MLLSSLGITAVADTSTSLVDSEEFISTLSSNQMMVGGSLDPATLTEHSKLYSSPVVLLPEGVIVIDVTAVSEE